MAQNYPKKKVLVVMSAYNGEQYIKDQLESIFSQSYQPFKILVRDDGSNDNTLNILRQYQAEHPNVMEVLCGCNIGPCDSFFELIWKAQDYDYLFLSDQDDVWKETKIERAIELLEKSGAALYCGKQEIVDHLLKPIDYEVYKYIEVKPGFGNALIENIAPGCTMCLTKRLVDILKQMGRPNGIYMHDWWIYLVAAAKGTVVYDKDMLICYRQHDNIVGSPTSGFSRLRRRIKNYSTMKGSVVQQAKQFVQRSDSGSEEFELARKFAELSFKDKVGIIMSSDIYRQKRIDTFLYKLSVLLW